MKRPCEHCRYSEIDDDNGYKCTRFMSCVFDDYFVKMSAKVYSAEKRAKHFKKKYRELKNSM